MANLPKPGQTNWGDQMNGWLLQSHSDDGKVNAVQGVPVLPIAPKHGQVMVFNARLGGWVPAKLPNDNAFGHAMVVNAIMS